MSEHLLLDIVGWHKVSTVLLTEGLYETAAFKRDTWDPREDRYDYANPCYQAQFVSLKAAQAAHKRCIKDILKGMKGCNPRYRVHTHVYG